MPHVLKPLSSLHLVSRSLLVPRAMEVTTQAGFRRTIEHPAGDGQEPRQVPSWKSLLKASGSVFFAATPFLCFPWLLMNVLNLHKKRTADRSQSNGSYIEKLMLYPLLVQAVTSIVTLTGVLLAAALKWTLDMAFSQAIIYGLVVSFVLFLVLAIVNRKHIQMILNNAKDMTQ